MAVPLKVIHIAIPPLRAMREDIPLLVTHFLAEFTRELGKGSLELTPEAMRCLENYDWPGNVRELAHEMKRLVVLSHGPLAMAAELSPKVGHTNRTTSSVNPVLSSGASLKTAFEELERQILHEALTDSKYNQVQTARKLGLSRQGLIKKLKRYGIVPRANVP
jgi:DNA-binding NtrC family response regulator